MRRLSSPKRARSQSTFRTPRYALHKLLVYAERNGRFLQKAQKDLWQAAALLELMKARRPWEVGTVRQPATGSLAESPQSPPPK